MAAIEKNLYVETGATYNIGFVYHAPVVDADGDVVLDPETGKPIPGEPLPLTGCQARMQVRAKVDSEEVLITATTGADPLTGGKRIALESLDIDGNPIVGRVDIELTDEDTMKLQGLRKAVYDLELIWPLEAGDIRQRVDRLLKGTIFPDPNVTRIEAMTATEATGG